MIVRLQIRQISPPPISNGIVQGIPGQTISKSAKFGEHNFQVREIRGAQFPKSAKSASFGLYQKVINNMWMRRIMLPECLQE
jgi:hypothetical protein